MSGCTLKLPGVQQELVENLVACLVMPNGPDAKKPSELVGLRQVKRVIQEAVIAPLEDPEAAKACGVDTSAMPRVLMVGPPGTGKTEITKALAWKLQRPLLIVTSSVVGSKWTGQAEKLMWAVFGVARYYGAVVFFDEIDKTLPDPAKVEHGDPKLVGEFQNRILEYKDVPVFAASNEPRKLNGAVRSRLQTTILVRLPDRETKKEMVLAFCRTLPQGSTVTEDDADALAESMSPLVSGRDLWMEPGGVFPKVKARAFLKIRRARKTDKAAPNPKITKADIAYQIARMEIKATQQIVDDAEAYAAEFGCGGGNEVGSDDEEMDDVQLPPPTLASSPTALNAHLVPPRNKKRRLTQGGRKRGTQRRRGDAASQASPPPPAPAPAPLPPSPPSPPSPPARPQGPDHRTDPAGHAFALLPNADALGLTLLPDPRPDEVRNAQGQRIASGGGPFRIVVVGLSGFGKSHLVAQLLGGDRVTVSGQPSPHPTILNHYRDFFFNGANVWVSLMNNSRSFHGLGIPDDQILNSSNTREQTQFAKRAKVASAESLKATGRGHVLVLDDWTAGKGTTQAQLRELSLAFSKSRPEGLNVLYLVQHWEWVPEPVLHDATHVVTFHVTPGSNDFRCLRRFFPELLPHLAACTSRRKGDRKFLFFDKENQTSRRVYEGWTTLVADLDAEMETEGEETKQSGGCDGATARRVPSGSSRAEEARMEEMMPVRVKWLCAALNRGSSAVVDMTGERWLCYPETKSKDAPFKPPYELNKEVALWRSAKDVVAAFEEGVDGHGLPETVRGFSLRGFSFAQRDDPDRGLRFQQELLEPPTEAEKRKGHAKLVNRTNRVLTELLDSCFQPRVKLKAPRGQPRPWAWGIANWETLVACATTAFGPGTPYPFFHDPDLPVESVLVIEGDFDPSKAPNFFLHWVQREIEAKRRDKAQWEREKRNVEERVAKLEKTVTAEPDDSLPGDEQMRASILWEDARERLEGARAEEESAKERVREVEAGLRDLRLMGGERLAGLAMARGAAPSEIPPLPPAPTAKAETADSSASTSRQTEGWNFFGMLRKGAMWMAGGESEDSFGEATAMEEGSIRLRIRAPLYETMELSSMVGSGLLTEIGPPHARRRVASFTVEPLPPLPWQTEDSEREMGGEAATGHDDSDDEDLAKVGAGGAVVQDADVDQPPIPSTTEQVLRAKDEDLNRPPSPPPSDGDDDDDDLGGEGAVPVPVATPMATAVVAETVDRLEMGEFMKRAPPEFVEKVGTFRDNLVLGIEHMERFTAAQAQQAEENIKQLESEQAEQEENMKQLESAQAELEGVMKETERIGARLGLDKESSQAKEERTQRFAQYTDEELEQMVDKESSQATQVEMMRRLMQRTDEVLLATASSVNDEEIEQMLRDLAAS